MPAEDWTTKKSRAFFFHLAAEAELAAGDNDNWLVGVEVFGQESGRIYLELGTHRDIEVQRGLDFLLQIVQYSKLCPTPRIIKKLEPTKDGTPQYLIQRPDGRRVRVTVPKK